VFRNLGHRVNKSLCLGAHYFDGKAARVLNQGVPV
jgi:hypothetical protein